MKQKNHFKEKISLQVIGVKKFWLGILAGLFSAIIISLSFNYMRELLRISTSISNDLQILNTEELIFFNYFFASISSVLGFSITIWFWMHHHFPTRKMGRIHSISAGVNAVLMFWVVLMLIVRFGPIFSLFFFQVPIDDQLLKLYDDDKLIFILLPMVIFFQNWVAIRLIYRVSKWIIISFILNIILTLILIYTTGINQQKFNNLYFSKYKTEFEFIDKEVVNAKIQYGINLNPETIETLKVMYKSSARNQVYSVKQSFSANKAVPLDTIILQKIIIRNAKNGKWLSNASNSIKNFFYAYPVDILRQIHYYPVNSNETTELFKILKEEIDLVNISMIDLNSIHKYSDFDIRRNDISSSIISTEFYDQLAYVRKKIINDKRYSSLVENLPKIMKENKQLLMFREMNKNGIN